jgi:hypothetical protein
MDPHRPALSLLSSSVSVPGNLLIARAWKARGPEYLEDDRVQ